jgi:acyl-CoA synthetase (AMP-forming)/AMP-acid ligase II
MTIYTSSLAPFSDITNLSIPQFMTRYNPHGVPTDKVVHMDTFSDEHLTYGSLREKASRAAWGLKNRLGVRPGDAVLAIVTNSVCLAIVEGFMVYILANQLIGKNDFVLLAHATWWVGGVFAYAHLNSF